MPKISTDETKVLSRLELDQMVNSPERKGILAVLNEDDPSPLWDEFTNEDLLTLTGRVPLVPTPSVSQRGMR